MTDETEDLQTETEAPPAPPRQSSDKVLVTITKFGEGKVSSGEHIAGEGDLMCARGDVIEVSKSVGASLEARGFGEIDA